MTDRKFGRVPSFDERSREFPTFRRLQVLPFLTKTWRRGAAYDQGSTPMCVAYTGKGLLNTAAASAIVPYATRTRYPVPEWYAGAQKRDQWVGEDYDGTSALGLGRYLTDRGVLTEYSWNFGLTDTLLCLSYKGPAGIGVSWKTGMLDTDANGFVHATGVDEGGHEVELIGINEPGRYVIGMNSWGPGWGVNGRFKLSWEDLGALLEEQGDSVFFTAKAIA